MSRSTQSVCVCVCVCVCVHAHTWIYVCIRTEKRRGGVREDESRKVQRDLVRSLDLIMKPLKDFRQGSDVVDWHFINFILVEVSSYEGHKGRSILHFNFKKHLLNTVFVPDLFSVLLEKANFQ